MSFVTRCPACATHFRVVADQLKISDGWVRCGQCGEVFDASAQLAALPAHAPEVEPESAAPLPVTAEAMPGSLLGPEEPPGPEPQTALLFQQPSVEPELEPPHVDLSNAWATTTFVELPESAETLPLSESRPEVLSEFQSWAERDAALDHTLRADRRADMPNQTPTPLDRHDHAEGARDSMYDLPSAAELLPPAPPATDDLSASDAVLAAFPEQVGFVRQAQRREGWQRPVVRWSLALLSLLLCLGLLLQWVLFERDRIAALRPDLRPALEALCRPLGCRVESLRLVQALSIESTTLARRGNGRYALEVVVRNASVFELALPALELSLTDVGDQLLLRRVILPSELPAPPTAVPANDTLTLRLEVLIDGPVGDALAGYRTLVFYP